MEDRYLFKAKRLDNGEWAEGHYITNEKDPNHAYIGYLFGVVDGMVHDTDIVEVIPSTICQCTGLKDKNGKLIWENDIMVAHLDDNYPEDETYIRILWFWSGFCSIENGSKDITPVDKFDQEHFEVICNIFDNPELLIKRGII